MLAFLAMVHGYQNNTLDYHIRKKIVGWSKESGRVTNTRAPILPVLLENKQWDVLVETIMKLLFKAVSLLTFQRPQN